MIVRVFVVVLTVIGAVPIRICTCGAAHLHETASEPVGEVLAGVSSEPAHHEHDADCHAVKPRPLMSIGLTCPATDVPPADDFAVAAVELPQLEPAAVFAVRVVDPPPIQPLFLTDGVLRI
jgi:hypothetical protein